MFNRLLLICARRLFRHWAKLAPPAAKLAAREQKFVRDVLMVAAGERRRGILRDVVAATGGVVAAGPFAGMSIDTRTSWGDGALIPKLLGCYEAEVIDALVGLKERAFDIVINIGCAEGFYSVAAARFLGIPRSVAVDLDPEARAATLRNAEANGAAAQVETRDHLDAAGLADLVAETPNALVISDCEGFELDLFAPETIAALGHAVCLIECHDFAGRAVLATLSERFGASHDLQVITEGPRDPNRFPVLRKLDSLERWLAISEHRPETMHWLLAVPKR